MSFKLDKPAMFSIDGYKRHSKDVNNKHNIIASGDITMEDVDFPVHGVDNLGNEKIMEPGKDYSFPGDIVLETPLKKSNMGYGKKYDSSHKKYEDTSFKMSGFPMHAGTKEYKSHLKQKEKPSVGSVVGDIDNRVGDALYDRDLLELGASLAQVSKDIETVKKAGKGEELENYITPETYKDVNAFLNSSPFDKKDFSRGKLVEEMSKDTELHGRWEGMTLSEFDKTLAEELDSYINSEPKPTAKEIKAFKERHAKNRRKAQGL